MSTNDWSNATRIDETTNTNSSYLDQLKRLSPNNNDKTKGLTVSLSKATFLSKLGEFRQEALGYKADQDDTEWKDNIGARLEKYSRQILQHPSEDKLSFFEDLQLKGS
eukprot:301382_1